MQEMTYEKNRIWLNEKDKKDRYQYLLEKRYHSDASTAVKLWGGTNEKGQDGYKGKEK